MLTVPLGVTCPSVGELGREPNGAVAPTTLLLWLPLFPPPAAKEVRRLSLLPPGSPCSSLLLPPTILTRRLRSTGSAMPLWRRSPNVNPCSRADDKQPSY